MARSWSQEAPEHTTASISTGHTVHTVYTEVPRALTEGAQGTWSPIDQLTLYILRALRALLSACSVYSQWLCTLIGQITIHILRGPGALMVSLKCTVYAEKLRAAGALVFSSYCIH